MKAILPIAQGGGPEVLRYADAPDPEPGPGEVLLDVAATAVNRADLVQRQGYYPPPEGASEILGLECSGTVAALGAGVEGVEIGSEVCALLAGGGYATRVAVPAGQVMPLPDGVDLVTAAALPEVAATVWSNVMMVAGLRAGDTFLVHGGAGGIGTFAIQLTKALGARVIATAGSPEKLALCRELGADVAIHYREQDFVEVVAEVTDGHGADVILDNMGASYLTRNLDTLGHRGTADRPRLPGRVEGGDRPTDPVPQARRRVLRQPARATRRREDDDLRGGRGARLAAGRGRDRSGDRRPHPSAGRGGRGTPAHGERREHRQDRAGRLIAPAGL